MSEPHPHDYDVFPTTQWSVVLAARADGRSGRLALDELCRKYWGPVRSFFRRHGADESDAEDLAQEYFASLLTREYLHQADRELGRFRAFLIQDLKFFLWNTLEKRRTEKRGEGRVFVPLDESADAAADSAGNTAFFDRQWALRIVETAREMLRAEHEAAGKGELFRLLQQGLVRTMSAADYEQWAARAGMTPGALKVALHRLRSRFRRALEDQVRETVASEGDFEEEMRHLRRALRDGLPES